MQHASPLTREGGPLGPSFLFFPQMTQSATRTVVARATARRGLLPGYLAEQKREQQQAVDLVQAFMRRAIRSPKGLARLVVDYPALDSRWDEFLTAMDAAVAEHKRLCRFA